MTSKMAWQCEKINTFLMIVTEEFHTALTVLYRNDMENASSSEKTCVPKLKTDHCLSIGKAKEPG